MADRTIRAVYEVTVDKAVSNLKRAGNAMEDLDKQSDQLARNLKQLSGATVNPKIDIEISKAEKAIRDFKGKLDDVKGYTATPKIDAEIGDSLRKLDDLGQKMRRLEQQKPSLKVILEAAKVQSEIEQISRKMNTLQGARARLQVTADARQAASQLADLENKARSLKGLRASMNIVADAKQAQATMSQVKSEAKSLDSIKAKIGITADKPDFSGITGAAQAEGGKAGSSAGKALMDGLKGQPIVGAVVGILGAAGLAGVAAFNAGLDKIAIDTKIGAQLNLTEKQVGQFGLAAGRTYARGFGDSYESAMGGLKAIKLNELLGTNASNAELEKMNSILLNTANLLGEDVSSTAEAAGALMKNGLAKNSMEAFDLIQRGMESGLNRSGDFLDTLREYPSMFGSMGLSAQDAGKLLEQSMDAGARNTDFAADALKEFSIRAQDASSTSAEGFQLLGLNAEEMTAKFARGGKDARDGLQQVLDGLRNIEDPVARNTAGVALFGTKWEDLGNGAQIVAMDLNKASASFDKIGGAAEAAMTKMESSISNKAQSAMRSMEMTFQSASASILAAFEPQISGFANYISTHQSEVLGFVKKVVDGVLTAAIGFVEFAASGVSAFGQVASAVGGLVTGLGKAVTAMGYLQGNQALVALGQQVEGAGNKMTEFGTNSENMANTMRNNMVPALETARDKFNNMIDPAIAAQKAQDAVAQINANIDQLSAELAAKNFDLKINGDTLPAKDALGLLMTEIQNSPDGMVTINGNKVPAEEALSTFMAAVDAGNGTVSIGGDASEGRTALEGYKYTIQSTKADTTIGANTQPAGSALDQFRVQANNTKGTATIDGNAAQGRSALDSYRVGINNTKGTATIDGNAAQGRSELQGLQNNINSTRGQVNVQANTNQASSAVSSLVSWISRQAPVMTIWQKVVKGRADGGWVDGKANGGFVNGGRTLPGRASGGFVNAPRTLPGKDNILWPLARGGSVLSQPLAGGEFVVNAKDAQRNRHLLEYMNKGGTFSAPASSGGIDTEVIANTIAAAISSAPIVAEVKDSRTAAAIVTMGQRHIR